MAHENAVSSNTLRHYENDELLKRVKDGDKKAEDLLLEINLPLVASLSKKFLGRGYDYDDIYQVGALGLIKAIKNFNSDYNVKFSTYAVPMILGNLLQQCYNIADTLIVGRFLGKNALAAVGSSFTLMTFLTSILLGLCMGSGTMISVYYGKRDRNRVKQGIFISFLMIGALTLLLNVTVFVGIDKIMLFLLHNCNLLLL